LSRDFESGLLQLFFDDDKQTLASQVEYQDDVPVGVFTTYYPNGERRDEKTLKNGKPDGKWTEWYDSGQIRGKGKYVNGEYDGYQRYYHPSGGKMQVRIYKNGTRIGTWTEWDESGNPVNRRVFSDATTAEATK